MQIIQCIPQANSSVTEKSDVITQFIKFEIKKIPNVYETSLYDHFLIK